MEIITTVKRAESNELYHHGILGMKWGVRRYQYKDGSLTQAGKKRYNGSVAANGVIGAIVYSKIKAKTAEEEYKGKNLKVSADDYRNKMILKYSGKDPNKAAFYTNASDELIQKEFVRRENVKKAVIAGTTVVGVTAACYIAYRMSVNKQLNPLGSNVTKDTVEKALKNAQDDLDFVLPKGSEIHRMVGTENFDLAKQVGKRTYGGSMYLSKQKRI